MTEATAGEVVRALFGGWYTTLLRYGAYLLRSRAAAEDAVQEAFMALYRQLRRGVRIRNPRAWTLAAVRNQAATELRNQNRHALQLRVVGGIPPLGHDPTQSFEEQEELAALLVVLSPREQEVVLLRLQNLKYREIAAELNLSCNSVNTLLARALRKLETAASAKAEGKRIQPHVENGLPKALQ